LKAFLWSLCLHIVLLGLLTYHHFAPTEAAKLKSEPPILAYAYQPIKTKPAAIVQMPVAAEPLKTTVPQPAVKAAHKTPVRVQHKKVPAVKAQSQKKQPQKNKPQNPRPQKAKPQPTKAKTIAAQPQRKPFVPVRKPAMVKPLPAVAKPIPLPVPKPLPAPKPLEVVAAAKPLPAPKPPEVVAAAKPLPVPKPPEVVAAAKPLPAPKPPEVVAAAKPLPVPKPAEVIPAKVIEAAKIAEVKVSSKAAQQDVKQGPSAAVSSALDHNKTIANKALQSARQGDDSGSASWKEKQKQLALDITATKSEQKPEVGRKVKTFADGSALIDTNPGCWKVPPPESRKDSIWLSTSIPCKPDTTVEQINDILQKRRTYTND
jgi:hypothetical protein